MSYFSEVLKALAGRAKSAAPPVAMVAPTEAQARAAALEMDLRERDERIAAMQKEYAALEASAKRVAAGAGQEQLEQIFKKLAAPLANLSTLAALGDAGREVAPADLISLLRSLEKQLKAAGLEQVGAPGESVTFDVALHQRMSGGAVSAGTPVVVRAPGYRCGGKVLLKAMVTSKESAHE
jgi:molecular chaperone GrpE (heat shock protein)